jgi:hypothetical protein
MNKKENKYKKLFSGKSNFGGVSEQKKEEVERDVNIELFCQHVLNHKEETELRFVDSNKEKPAFSRFCCNLDEVKHNCQMYNGRYNIYAGINERSKSGKKDKDVISISCLFFDADAHNGEQIDDAKRDIYSLISKMEERFGSLRYLIVFTGHGYSLFVPIDAISPEYSNAWRRLSESLCVAATDGDSTGTFDISVWNISRVMRVPGTLNIKSDPIRSFIYDTNFPTNPQNKKISRAIKEMGKDEFEEEEEDGGKGERKKDYAGIDRDRNNLSPVDETEYTGESDYATDKGLCKYQCEWLTESLYDPSAAHEPRRETVSRMNLALQQDYPKLDVRERVKIIFNFLKGCVRWSDYTDSKTLYQVQHIVSNAYKPAQCKKLACPHYKECDRRNFWRKKKNKRVKRFEQGAEAWRKRIKEISKQWEGGDDEDHILDIRHCGAGKSYDSRLEVTEGVFIYPTCEARDQACDEDPKLDPIVGRFEWGCDQEDVIEESMRGGQRPIGCFGCPYNPWEDEGTCGYPLYFKDAIKRGEHKKIAVTLPMAKSYGIQQRNDQFVLDDCPFSKFLTDKIILSTADIKHSFDLLYGEDGLSQHNMADVLKDEFRKALNGDEQAKKLWKDKIDDIREIRHNEGHAGREIPINLARLAQAYKVKKRGNDLYQFMIFDDTVLKREYGGLKCCRVLSATPSYEDIELIKKYYPYAQILRDKGGLAEGVKITQVTDGAYSNATLKYPESRERLGKALRNILRIYKARGELDHTVVFCSKKSERGCAKIIEDFRGVRLEHFFGSESKGVNDLKKYNNAIIYGTPPVSPIEYEDMYNMLSKNLCTDGEVFLKGHGNILKDKYLSDDSDDEGMDNEAFLTSEEFQYVKARDEVLQCIGRLRPYDAGKKCEIVLLTNIDISNFSEKEVEHIDLNGLIRRAKVKTSRSLSQYVSNLLKYAKEPSLLLKSLAADLSAEFGISERSARREIDKAVRREVQSGTVVVIKDRSKKGRGRKPLLAVFIHRLKTLFDERVVGALRDPPISMKKHIRKKKKRKKEYIKCKLRREENRRKNDDLCSPLFNYIRDKTSDKNTVLFSDMYTKFSGVLPDKIRSELRAMTLQHRIMMVRCDPGWEMTGEGDAEFRVPSEK